VERAAPSAAWDNVFSPSAHSWAAEHENLYLHFLQNCIYSDLPSSVSLSLPTATALSALRDGLRLYRRPSADGLEGLTKPGRLKQNHPELAEVAPAQCGVNRPSFPFVLSYIRVGLVVFYYPHLSHFTIVYIYRANFTQSCCSTSTLYIMYFRVNTYQYIRAVLCQELRPV
jgi:hypothetical protein